MPYGVFTIVENGKAEITNLYEFLKNKASLFSKKLSISKKKFLLYLEKNEGYLRYQEIEKLEKVILIFRVDIPSQPEISVVRINEANTLSKGKKVSFSNLLQVL